MKEEQQGNNIKYNKLIKLFFFYFPIRFVDIIAGFIVFALGFICTTSLRRRRPAVFVACSDR